MTVFEWVTTAIMTLSSSAAVLVFLMRKIELASHALSERVGKAEEKVNDQAVFIARLDERLNNIESKLDWLITQTLANHQNGNRP